MPPRRSRATARTAQKIHGPDGSLAPDDARQPQPARGAPGAPMPSGEAASPGTSVAFSVPTSAAGASLVSPSPSSGASPASASGEPPSIAPPSGAHPETGVPVHAPSPSQPSGIVQ